MLRANRHLWDAKWLRVYDDETVHAPAEPEEELMDFIEDHDTDFEDELFFNDANSGDENSADEEAEL